MHEEIRLTTDLGLAGMSLFSVIIAIFVGVNLVYKELELKTIYTLIPKPIHRYQFVLGKFCGMLLTLATLLVIMALVLLGVLELQGAELGAALAKMVLLIFLEVVVITAVAVLFSSFSTPFLSGMFTLGIFLLGRSVPDIRQVAERTDNPLLAALLNGISHLVPNLKVFYVTGSEIGGAHVTVHGNFPDWAYLGWAGGYALIVVTLVLLISVLLFSRRDFI